MKLDRGFYKAAWQRFKSHYFLNVMVVFIVAILLNDGYNYSSDWNGFKEQPVNSYMLSENRKQNSEIIAEFIKGQGMVNIDLPEAETTAEKYTMGYFSVIVNEVTASRSIGFGLLNGLNKIVFHGKIAESVTIFAMVAASALYWIFIKNMLIVGRCRYFLERRLYPETKADRLLFVYRTGNMKNVAKIMLIRTIKQVLWNITIIGGVIKCYEYVMIPYILAENPTISTKEAFALSRQMMMKDKMTAFRLDLSLLPLALLDGATFHLTSLFLLNPYRECLYAEMYTQLRSEKRSRLERGELLYDNCLMTYVNSPVYPDSECPTPYLEKHRWLVIDYNKTYGGDTPILFFFFFSFIGWGWEVFFYLINEGTFINRGTMTGPWLPIYGVGGWIIIYGLRGLRKDPLKMFIGAFIVCGSVEYFTSWLLEKLLHQRWWDYEGYFMNINGRICLEGLLVFGLAGVTMTYFIAPIVDNLFAKIPKKVRHGICAVLITAFFADLGWSVKHPNSGDGITEGFH